ncbi:MAG: hypothetical protein JRI23_17480 [Deltaproteobacteria bacterium]|jgi:hypothetical protein|nr:hypothetical protein [Deltaproteobacteria bacterium]MBW2533613.1 hypothetical protein [Deltaproteobacteria bacterium]
MVTFVRPRQRKPRLLCAGAVLFALVASGSTAPAAPGAGETPDPKPDEVVAPTGDGAGETTEPTGSDPDGGAGTVDDAVLEYDDELQATATPAKSPPKRTRKQAARKQRKPAISPSAPHALHAPVSVAMHGEPLQLDVDLTNPAEVKQALLVFRAAGEKGFRALELRRGEPGPYVAVIPAKYVQAPHLEYTIEIESRDGKRYATFGSRQAPHRVQVPEDYMDKVEAHVGQRVEDRRAVFWSGGEYVSFGTSTAQVPDPAAPDGPPREQTVKDWYYRVEGGFTYRLLRTVSEFGIRIGVVRGSAPVPLRDLQPGQDESERFDVGLNYGAPWIRFRLADHWHLDGSFLVNVTEVGFSAGTGAKLHIGDPYGSKLTMGFEAIQTFGSSFFTQLDIQAHDRLRVSPIVEVTNAPSADDFGMRLLAEVGWNIGWGFSVAGRGGYQARLSTSGGPTAGGSLAYAF